MATNPGQPHYGPYQPVPMPPQHIPYPTTVGTQSCYNCGSSAHMAQFCPEPRRAVPAGVMAQKSRLPKTKQKGSKPVITRYAPPPGYVPPQAGAIPPPPPPPPPVVPPPPYAQQGAYPQHGAQQYAPATTPTTPHWQPSPQSYVPPSQQWQQQQQQQQQPPTPTYGPQQPPTPAYGPHQPPQHQAPQPGYNAYGQPHSPYAAQHSPAQPYPPQPAYSPSHLQPPPPHPNYPQYNTQQQVPQPPVQPPQTPYAPPQLQVPAYPQTAQYQLPSPSFPPPKPPPQAGWQPYQPPPQTNYPQFPPKGPGPTPYSRPPLRDFRQNAHSPNQHHVGRGGRGGGSAGGGGGGGGGSGAGGRVKQFQPPLPAESVPPRPPSPPHFFSQPSIASAKTKSGALIWKSPQRVDHPIGPTVDPDEMLTNPLASTAADVPASKGKNAVGSKYFDSEGNLINREEIEGNEDMKRDPVWDSARTNETTRIDMQGYVYVLTAEDEELVNQLKVNITGGEKGTANGNASDGDSADPSGSRKSEGKKRSWDEFLNTNKPGQDQERRPNKRRYGNDWRTRRNNRNRHGNKVPGNRSTQQDTAMAGTQNTEAPQPVVHRSVHPLPPKPVTGPPPPPSSYVDNTPPNRQHPSSHYGGKVESEAIPHPRLQSSSNRRSTSPPRQQETNYRQRDYEKRKTDNPGLRARNEKANTATRSEIGDNADARYRGRATTVVSAYSRRW